MPPGCNIETQPEFPVCSLDSRLEHQLFPEFSASQPGRQILDLSVPQMISVYANTYIQTDRHLNPAVMPIS